jgi:mono/diheme cytochrome c family protein
VIDLTAEQEILERRIDIDNRSLPVAAAFSPLGDYVYVLAQGSNFLGVFDAYRSSQHLGGIQHVGAAPNGLVLLPDLRLVVNGNLSRDLLAYDVARSVESADHMFAGPTVTVKTSEEPLRSDVANGKRIFFDASDPRMSEHGYVSCAACHYDGGHDGRVWDFSDRGEGLRNTKILLGSAGTGRLHASANFDEVQDFERDIRESQGGVGFMGESAWQRASAAGPLGPSLVGVSEGLDALAAYVGSLDRVGRSPFRNADGSLTADAIAGRKVFQHAGCARCHPGSRLTDSASGLLHDVGTLRETSGARLYGPLTGLDTPTLRGVFQTAPYLHDGRATTIEEIFTQHNPDDRLGFTSQLSEIELSRLAAFVRELDDSPLPTTVATSPVRTSAGCSLTEGRDTSSRRFLIVLALGWVSARARRWQRPTRWR